MLRKRATVKRTEKKTTNKAANTSAARTVKKAVRKTLVKSSPIQEYEQTIAKARVELGKAHIKAVVQCQKHVEKLQTQLNRILVKQKSLRDKKEVTTQQAAEKGTQGSKKQAARAREALQVVNEKIKEIRADLKAAKLALNSARSAQKKFAASEKQLEKFEQDWIKASRPRRKIRRRTRNAAATETKEEISAPTVEETEVVPAESENPTQEVSAET
ncbi:MAG: hypothetical protein HKM94_00910 [Halobacteria archaeon]|nr:hypothetical protein [Halobacteria archaeon]